MSKQSEQILVRCSQDLKGKYTEMSKKFGLSTAELGRIALEEYAARNENSSTLTIKQRMWATDDGAKEDPPGSPGSPAGAGDLPQEDPSEITSEFIKLREENVPSRRILEAAILRLGEVLAGAPA